MARPTHLMWRICHIFIYVLHKSKKNTAQSHSTMRLSCHLLRLKEFHHVSDSNLPILRQFSKFHSDFFGDLRCFSFSANRLSVPTSKAVANFFRVLNPISPFVPFSYLEMSARSISTASLSCFCDQPFLICTFLYFGREYTPRCVYQPRLHLLSNPTDFRVFS